MATVSSAGGFEYQFVSSPPDIVVCKICHLPTRDPHLTICCGHVFCKSCLDGMKEAKSIVDNICPVCRGEDFVTVPNKQIDREVKSLHVYCTNKGRGCEWQGEVNYIDNHLTKDGGCEYEEVLCTSGCDRVIQRQDLTKHVETECPCRTVDCQYCQLRGEHQFIEGKHKEECVEYPLACPNKCGEAECIPRKDMNEHRSRCPLEVIDCEYQTMGCEVRMIRQTQKEHNKEKMEYHLHLTKCKLDETNCELSKTTSKLNDAMKELSTSKEEFTDVKNQFSDRISALEKLLRQNSTNDQASASISMPVHDWLIQLQLDTQSTSPGNRIVPVTFKMTAFTKKRKNKRDWYSDPFYSHNKGYRLCLVVDTAGCDDYEGTHCSMYLFLMRGRHDDQLEWPLKIKLKLILLNQMGDKNHCSGTINFAEASHVKDVTHRVIDEDMAESGRGCPDFISHKELTKITPTCQFLKNDCIFVRVCKP